MARKQIRGEAPGWTGRTGLGMVSPAKQERVLRTQSGFCSPEPVAVWGKGATQGKDIHPNTGKGPRQHSGRGTAGQRLRWPGCSLLLHAGPTFSHLDSGHNTIPTMLGAFMRIKCTRPGICKVLSRPEWLLGKPFSWLHFSLPATRKKIGTGDHLPQALRSHSLRGWGTNREAQ